MDLPEVPVFTNVGTAATALPIMTMDSQEESDATLESSHWSDVPSHCPADTKKRKKGASKDYAHEVLELQLEVLAEEREVLKKRDIREEKLNAKRKAVIDTKEARNAELRNAKMAFYEAKTRNIRDFPH